MLTAQRLRDLARLSVLEPQRGGAAVLALNPSIEARWMAMAAAVLVGVVLAYLLPVLAGRAAEMPTPLTAVAIQGGANLLAAVLMTQVGRSFGGQGGFADALLLVAWLQALMVGLQLVQLVVLLILPPLAGMVLVLALGVFFWLLVGFVQALHGFRSTLLVLMGTVGAMFTAAVVVSFVLILLGVEMPEMTDV